MSDVPTSYTLAEFKAFLLAELEASAVALGRITASDQIYANAMRRTLRVIGESAVADCDPGDLEVVGPVEIWRGVLAEVATDTTYSADSSSFNLDNLTIHAEGMFNRAKAEAKLSGFYLLDLDGATSSSHDTCVRW